MVDLLLFPIEVEEFAEVGADETIEAGVEDDQEPHEIGVGASRGRHGGQQRRRAEQEQEECRQVRSRVGREDEDSRNQSDDGEDDARVNGTSTAHSYLP